MSNKRRLLLLLGIIIAVGFATFYIVSHMAFRITGTSPRTDRYPASLGTLEVRFNKSLDTKYIEQQFDTASTNIITPNFKSAVRLKTSEKSLTFTFSQTPVAGKYSIKLSNIKSTSGAVFSKTLPFNVVNVSYDDLGESDKALYDALSGTGEESTDPAATLLPYENGQYTISYEAPSETNPGPATITITTAFYPPGDNALPATQDEMNAYYNTLRIYRRQALDWLSTNKIDINKYHIVYTEPYIQEEFPSGIK